VGGATLFIPFGTKKKGAARLWPKLKWKPEEADKKAQKGSFQKRIQESPRTVSPDFNAEGESFVELSGNAQRWEEGDTSSVKHSQVSGGGGRESGEGKNPLTQLMITRPNCKLPNQGVNGRKEEKAIGFTDLVRYRCAHCCNGTHKKNPRI